MTDGAIVNSEPVVLKGTATYTPTMDWSVVDTPANLGTPTVDILEIGNTTSDPDSALSGSTTVNTTTGIQTGKKFTAQNKAQELVYEFKIVGTTDTHTRYVWIKTQPASEGP